VSAVTVATTEQFWGASALTFTREFADIRKRPSDSGITCLENSQVAKIDECTVELISGERLEPFDSIVFATGTRPRAYPEDAKAAGDCIAPRDECASERRK
jgi:hypothetical protein